MERGLLDVLGTCADSIFGDVDHGCVKQRFPRGLDAASTSAIDLLSLSRLVLAGSSLFWSERSRPRVRDTSDHFWLKVTGRQIEPVSLNVRPPVVTMAWHSKLLAGPPVFNVG